MAKGKKNQTIKSKKPTRKADPVSNNEQPAAKRRKGSKKKQREEYDELVEVEQYTAPVRAPPGTAASKFDAFLPIILLPIFVNLMATASRFSGHSTWKGQTQVRIAVGQVLILFNDIFEKY